MIAIVHDELRHRFGADFAENGLLPMPSRVTRLPTDAVRCAHCVMPRIVLTMHVDARGR
jgi:hypothetical protein